MSSIVNVSAQSAVSEEKCEKKNAIKELTSLVQRMSQPPAGNIRVVKVLAALCYIPCMAAVMQAFSPSLLVMCQKWGDIIMLEIKKKMTNVLL